MNKDIIKGIAYTIGALSFAIVCLQIKDNGIHSVIACAERPHVTRIPAIPAIPYGEPEVASKTEVMNQFMEALPPLPVDVQTKIYRRGR